MPDIRAVPNVSRSVDIRWTRAETIKCRRFVAVKLCQGNDETHSSTEAQILQSTRETQTAPVKSPGSENVVSLYDSFIVRGPNGHHQCLVTEVLLPWTGLERILWREFDHKNIIKQVAMGFAFLHRQGIVHGGAFNSKLGHLTRCGLADYSHTFRSDSCKHRTGCASNRSFC